MAEPKDWKSWLERLEKLDAGTKSLEKLDAQSKR